MSETTKPESAPETEHEIPESTAVRVYDHADAATEFPVLKAFQEYLEAEQAKAHKRMLSLSIFFIVLLVIVVLTFTIITSSVINRNQKLSERLMDIALHERTGNPQTSAPIVNAQQPTAPAASASVKPIMDKLEQLQSELAKARAEAEAQRKAAAEARAQAQAPAAAVQSRAEDDRQERAATEKAIRQLEEIRKQQAAIKAAREQLKTEQEALRKEQIEQQRRRLYPEYYAQEDARRAAEEAAKNPPNALLKPQLQEGRALPAAAQQLEKPLPPTQPQATQDNKTAQPVVGLPQIQTETKSQANPSVKTSSPQPSALQAILDEDDAPKSAPKTPKLTPEEAAKVQAELKNLMAQADRLEEEAKEMAKQKKDQKAPPLPEANPKLERTSGTESLEVGGKNGKTIPWLLSLPGEIPVPEKDDDGIKMLAPRQSNGK